MTYVRGRDNNGFSRKPAQLLILQSLSRNQSIAIEFLRVSRHQSLIAHLRPQIGSTLNRGIGENKITVCGHRIPFIKSRNTCSSPQADEFASHFVIGHCGH